MEALRMVHCSLGSKQSLPAAAAELHRAPNSGFCVLRRRISQASQQGALALILTGVSSKSQALALDYNDIIGRGASPLDEASTFGPSDGIDLSVIESVLGFASDNPAAVAGGVLAIAVPFIVSRFLGGKQPYGSVSAREAYEKLAAKDSPEFQIIDIRDPVDIKTEGTPDLREARKRIFQISFDPSKEAAFVGKVKSKFKAPENTTLYILDGFDGNSATAAKLLVNNGFKEAYGIRGGAEGGRGWRQSDLPWLEPRKGLSFDSLKDAIQLENDILPATLGVAAAAGVGLVVFSEAETALQLVGTLALLQLFAKKFLFAEDRKKTFKEIKTFLDTKVAPKELVDELKGVGKALLPNFEEVSPETSTVGSTATSTETESPAPAPVSSTEAPVSTETPEFSPVSTEDNGAPSESSKEKPPEDKKTEVLSPYSKYPDLKPPSSPSPSRP